MGFVATGNCDSEEVLLVQFDACVPKEYFPLHPFLFNTSYRSCLSTAENISYKVAIKVCLRRGYAFPFSSRSSRL